MSSAAKRIQKELAEISLEPPTNCSAGPKGDNLYEWVSSIMGPAGSRTPAACSSWTSTFPGLPVQTPEGDLPHADLPLQREQQRPDLPGHPEGTWCPSTISKVLSICSLLTDANPHDPLVGSIAQQFLNDRPAHDKTANEWTRRYAQG